MKKVVIEQIKYEAVDGTQFDAKRACMTYEKLKLGIGLPEAEAIHRNIQRMKARHGHRLAKSFREYRNAKKSAIGWFRTFMHKSERNPETAEKLSKSMAYLAWSWSIYRKDLDELKRLRGEYRKAKAKAEEKKGCP